MINVAASDITSWCLSSRDGFLLLAFVSVIMVGFVGHSTRGHDICFWLLCASAIVESIHSSHNLAVVQARLAGEGTVV